MLQFLFFFLFLFFILQTATLEDGVTGAPGGLAVVRVSEVSGIVSDSATNHRRVTGLNSVKEKLSSPRLAVVLAGSILKTRGLLPSGSVNTGKDSLLKDQRLLLR